MAHYSLWIPKGEHEAAKALAAIGMSDLCVEGDLSPTAMPLPMAGPCGGPGVLIQWLDPSLPGERQPRMGYHKELQTWKALPAYKVNGALKPQGTAWIGFDKDRPLQPADLLRRSKRSTEARYQGRLQVLGDGQIWQLPSMLDLPMEFAIDPETGEDKKVVVNGEMPVWTRLQEALTVARNAFLRDQNEMWGQLPESEQPAGSAPEKPSDLSWNDFQIHDFNIWALSLNYRTNKLIAVELHLFNSGNAWHVLFDVTDRAVINRLLDSLKKTETLVENWHRKKLESPATSGGATA